MNYATMRPLGLIRTQHADGSPRLFEVKCETETVMRGRKWHFMVRPVLPADDSGESYYATLAESGDDMAQVETTWNHLPEPFHKSGISRALFPRAATLLGRTVRSSRNPAPSSSISGIIGGVKVTFEQVEETLSEPARRVWERLVRDGLATYDPDTDRFYCPPGQAAFDRGDA